MLLMLGIGTSAMAACSSPDGNQTMNCSGQLPTGAIFGSPTTTLNVNSLSLAPGDQISLTQKGGDGGNGRTGVLFVPPSGGGGGGSTGSSLVVTTTAVDGTSGVVTINFTNGAHTTFTPIKDDDDNITGYSEIYTDGSGPSAPVTLDGVTIAAGTTGSVDITTPTGSFNVAPGADIGAGSPAANILGNGLQVNYDGTGQTLTIAGKPAVIGVSQGGEGGDGGAWYAGGGGASGGSGGNAGAVQVTTKGNIDVTGGYGVVAQSIGGQGGNGGNSGGIVGKGGNAGRGGAAGTASVIIQGGTITTHGANAVGVAALSLGGRGGAGGSGYGIVGSGGGASSAGAGGEANVTVDDTAVIITNGDGSHAILAQSIGGTGGSSGAGGGLVALGDSAGTGGDAGNVSVNNAGTLVTDGLHAYGILAQSIGGGGGQGSGTGGLVALGNGGGAGGNGGQVSVDNSGSITTKGLNSVGIFAQSIGGGGGDGGSSAGLGAIGGSASSASGSGPVSVTNEAGGSITTYQSFSDGIFAQSVGGGGGNGGSGGGVFTVGGSGGNGGNGGTVTVTSAGSIVTGVNAMNAPSSNVTDSSGIFVQSVGGGGGNGGGAVAVGVGISMGLGGTAGDGGTGATVSILRDNADPNLANSASIVTWGDRSDGIFAQSVGGGGGNGGFAVSVAAGPISAGVALGGTGGKGGAASDVIVQTKGSIETHGNDSTGIFAQSVGGGGGNGGLAVAGSTGLVSASVSLGGNGSDGGAAGTVNVSNLADIFTAGDNSSAIIAQSVGGGGGNGGQSVAAGLNLGGIAVGLGGKAAGGGDGSTVQVDSQGTIHTQGSNATGIIGQSVGGGGGNGGFAVAGQISAAGNVSVGLGGSGGAGGNGGAVTIDAFRPADSEAGAVTLMTEGDNSAGILAQSVGGGGGNGGFAGALAVSGGVSASVALGGTGGDGGTGGVVVVNSTHTILTQGDNATGIVAQSIGGGGGNGGFAVAAAGTVPLLGVSGSVGVSLGGSGGTGNSANTVNVTSNGGITTQGNWSDGVLAQSIGGGGGNGGFSLAGSFSVGGVGAASVAIGGSGGAGADASAVTLGNTGPITTSGDSSNGLVAQSIGGGGGNGGFSGAASISSNFSIGVSVGGTGSGGGNGSGVSLTNDGDIQVTGSNAAGIFAQSIGGGGGNGGSAIAATLGASAGLSVAVGRSGGSGGTAANVEVTSNGTIVNGAGTGSPDAGTYKASTANGGGIIAQSIGGSGGNGGFSGALGLGGLGGLSLALGGDGGDGGSAGSVNVQNGTERASAITTLGDLSAGITAQSIGGGGGNGGFGIGVSASGVVSLSASVGGAGGAGNTSSTVTVGSTGDIITYGNISTGILAQSIGGGGGNGGFAVSGSLSIAPEGGAAAAVAVGGSAGDGATAGAVDVTNTGMIATFGASSNGILAQSLGGGGGNGGFAAAGAITISPEGGASISVAVGGAGGKGGTAGEVTVDQTGNVGTFGDLSSGVVAQSIGGGGGNGGFAATLAVNVGNGAAVGASVGGSGGDGAQAGDVDVRVNGDMSTDGTLSSGILAQSIGGSGGNGGFAVAGSLQVGDGAGISASVGGFGGDGGKAGNVTVAHTGGLLTQGDLSIGILAQSIGGGGGNGGFAGSLGGTIGQGVALGVSVGGLGGDGAQSGDVKVTNTGNIGTLGVGSTAIFAQSIGGNGGNGGSSLAAAVGVGEQNVSLAVSVGGEGGDGAKSGRVEVDSTGVIQTLGTLAQGIWAQSIGGNGGNGGFSVAGNLNVSTGAGGSASVSVGGFGGDGSTGGDVTVNSNVGTVLTDNNATIQTGGTGSNGIYAQSIGGGGGNGGFSGALSIAISEQATASFGISVGGFGGSGNDAGSVTVNSVDNILTGSADDPASGNGSNGIFAQSVGGGGGDGGFSAAATIAGGSSQSTQASVSLSLGGLGGAAGDGGDVTVDSTGLLTTFGDHADGVLAQSVGGGGGNGGFSIAGALGVSAKSIDVGISIGGFGGGGGTGGDVDITRNGSISTAGDYSMGIAGQSIGGGGGNGGLSISGAFGGPSSKNISAALGGFGGPGTGAGTVAIDSTGDILTKGLESHAIFAQSVGGGGGTGGLAGSIVAGVGGENTNVNFAASVGGFGGSGGTGNDVSVTSDGHLQTEGDNSQGILAQSIGGGGGDGGSSVSGSLGLNGEAEGRTVNITLAVGGAGGNGNTAGNVVVDQSGSILTSGFASNGIEAQSIGGGGGIGGQSNTISFTLASQCTLSVACTVSDEAKENIKKNFSFQASVGGFGGTGNDAGTVTVNNDGSIGTTGDFANGIFAQSIGGGGGDGGNGIVGLDDLVPSPYSYATYLTKAFNASGKKYAVAVGGYSGSAGEGNTVDITNTGQISTTGYFAAGIFAQSIGGGGGTNGNGVAGITGTVGIGGGALADLFGADVGGGGNGGLVKITNGDATDEMIGAIQTTGLVGADAILAQSIGGGGGQGGSGSGFVDIGGDGGVAGDGGVVDVANYAQLSTQGLYSSGIMAQSLGGGGGLGGGGSLSLIAIGGGGAAAGDGGSVSVTNGGSIFTMGDESDGVAAQSVGGGGGRGGGFLYDKQTIVETAKSVNLLQIGGSGGAAGNGGTVRIDNTGFVATNGDDSNGLFAQSVGGGGGIGGGGLGAAVLGGGSGAAGTGGDVTITNAAGGQAITFAEGADPITISVITVGNESNAIMAQSIGGGGGSSGETYGLVAFERGAADGSNGGAVTVDNAGSLATFGQNSTAIFAQSVGGGGGYAAAASGFGAWGADAGGGGDGGVVKVTNTADLILTTGVNAHGIFAQSIAGGGGVVNSLSGVRIPDPFAGELPESVTGVVTSLIGENGIGIGFAGSAGGKGKAGDVTVDQTGDIFTTGEGSFAILAQSAGETNGNIAITVNADSNVVGGTGLGAGVGFLDGAANTLQNAGLVTDLGEDIGLVIDTDKSLVATGWIDGTAVYGTAGSEAVTNANFVTGSVDLGMGTNSFDNQNGAWFVMGKTVALGTDVADLYTNAGFMTPGGINRVFTTDETGYFKQTADGTYMLDFDFDRNATPGELVTGDPASAPPTSPAQPGEAPVISSVLALADSKAGFTDLLNVSGTAGLAGTLSINLLNPGKATPGTSDHTIVHTEEGVADDGMTIDSIPTAVANYSLLFTDKDAILHTVIDFAPDGLTQNATAVGNTINAIQTDQTSPNFVPLAAAIFFQPTVADLQKSYDSISGEGTAGIQQTAISDAGAFMGTVMQQANFWRNSNAVDLTGRSVGGCTVNAEGKIVMGKEICDERLWRAWITGYGGGSNYDGNAVVGSGTLKSHNQGLAAGLDYQIDPNYLIGFTVGGGHSSFGVDDRLTTGKVDTGHIAFYGATKQGNFYVNGLLGIDFMHATTRRYAMIQGTDLPINAVPGAADWLADGFDGTALSGRFEAGYKKSFSGVNVTPFVALQFTSLRLDGSTEHAQGTPGSLALDYNDRTINSLPSFLGAQIDTRFYFGDDTYLEPFVRASWVHEFENRRSIEAGFTAAPGYDFVVYGAAAPRDSALVEAGATLVSSAGLSLYGKFTGNFSKSSHDLSGSGGLRYSW